MDFWIDDLHRHHRSQCRERSQAVSTHFGAHPVPRAFHAHTDASLTQIDLPKDNESRRTRPNEAVEVPRPKRPTPPKDIKGL
jgi:hypothetical protein